MSTGFNNFDSTFDSMFNQLSQLGFGSPINIRFNTGNTKDMNPAVWKVWEQDIPDSTEKEQIGYKAICRTVGIREDDIKLELRDFGLCLDGTSDVDENRYSQHIELPISREIMRNIENITYHSQDGLTYIFVRMKRPEIHEVPILKSHDVKELKEATEESKFIK